MSITKDLAAEQAVGATRYEHKLPFKFSVFVFAVLRVYDAAVYISPRPPSSVRCGSHGATAAAHEGTAVFPSGPARTVFMRVCVRVCASFVPS